MKLIIIGTDINEGISVAKALQDANDDLQIAPVFTTDLNMQGKTGEIYYYMSHEEVELSYRNNAFMWVRTMPSATNGVTMTDMYASSIFAMTYGDFNNISSPVLNEICSDEDDEFLIAVLDNTNTKKKEDDLLEASCAGERIYSNEYLYFLDSTVPEIVEYILKYMASNKEERKSLADALNN